MKKLLLALFLASTAHAGDIVISEFQGLNTEDNPASLAPSEAQDLLNVDIIPGGKGVKKREGYGLQKTLTYSTSAVHGAHYFQDTSGSNIQLWGNDIYIQGTVNGASIVNLATITVNSTMQCADSAGYAYCLTSSRNTCVRTDGTASGTSFLADVPKGTMVTFTPDRMVVAGVSGAESTLYFSQANTPATFTTGVLEASPFTEVINAPGSRINHIRYACGKVLWWKDTSFGYTIGNNQFDLENVIISPNIGSLDNSSDEYNGHVYFRGQDSHIYDYDCSNVTRLSRKITPNVAGAGRRRANSWTQTTQSDFANGQVTLNGTSLALSTSIVSGEIRPNTTTFIDTSASDFNNGIFSNAIDTTTVSGAFTLKTYLNDTFSNMNNWTQYLGSVDTSGGLADFDEATHLIKTSTYTPTGDFIIQWDYSDTAASAQNEYFELLIATSTSVNTRMGGYVITIQAQQSTNQIRVALSSTSATSIYFDGVAGGFNANVPFATGFFISSATIGTYSGTSRTIKWTRDNTTGAMEVYWGGTLVMAGTNTDFSNSGFTSVNIAVSQAPGLGHQRMDNFYLTARKGSFTSQTFDTVFSTPIWGTFAATGVNSGTYEFSTKTSADSSSFDAVVAVTTGSLITSSAKRYIKYSSTLTTTGVTSLPQVTDVTIVANSTGTYYSAVNFASGVSGWSTFGVNDTVDGTSFTYYVRASTASFIVLSSTPVWVQQSKNSTVNYATGTYMQMKVDFAVTYATGTNSLSDFTFNWFEGSAVDKAYIKYWNDGVWVAVSSGTSGLNNRIFRWDLLNQTWLLDDIGSNGFLVDSGDLYLGSPSAGKVYKFGQGVTTDDAGSINSYWKSKNFTGDDPFVQNTFSQSDFIVKAASPTVMSVSYQMDGSTTSTTYSMNLYNATKTILHKGVNIPAKTGVFYNVQFGDNSSNPLWEVYGYRAKYVPLPWKPE